MKNKLERRWKALHIPPAILLELLKPGTAIVPRHGKRIYLETTPEIPTDAMLHHAYYDQQAGNFVAVIEHPEFSSMAEGAHIECVDLAAMINLPEAG